MVNRQVVAELLIAVAMFSSLIGCRQIENREQDEDRVKIKSTIEKIKERKIIRVGYVAYPPTVVKDPNSGLPSGHFIDAIEYVADSLGVKTEYHEDTFAGFTASLNSDKFDVAVAALYRTIPRAAQVAFTRPIIYIGNGAIVRKGDVRFKNVASLNQKGVRLAVAQGEASHEYAKAHFQNANLTVLSTSDLSMPMLEVVAGRADVGLADAWSTAQFAARESSVEDLFATAPYDLTAVGWAVKPSDLEFLQFLNTTLDYLESTGRMSQWEAKYDAHWVRPRISYEVR